MPLSVTAARKYLLIGTWGNPVTFDMPFGPGLYGLHWWFNGLVGETTRRHWPDAPLDTFAAIGNYPHSAIFVIPSLRMVVAAHGDWSGGSYDTPPREASRGQPHRYWDPRHPGGRSERAARAPDGRGPVKATRRQRAPFSRSRVTPETLTPKRLPSRLSPTRAGTVSWDDWRNTWLTPARRAAAGMIHSYCDTRRRSG